MNKHINRVICFVFGCKEDQDPCTRCGGYWWDKHYASKTFYDDVTPMPLLELIILDGGLLRFIYREIKWQTYYRWINVKATAPWDEE